MAKKITRSEEESYRVPFFIISSMIMASCLWLLYQEFFTRRPWKNNQIAFFEIEKARAKRNLDAEKAFLTNGTLVQKGKDGEEQEIDLKSRIAELEQTIAELEGNIVNSPKRVEFETLKNQLEQAKIAVKDAEIAVAFAKADEDEYYYYYRNAKHHADDPGEQKFGKRVKEIQADVAKREKEYNAAVKKRDAIDDKLNAIREKLGAAKRELTSLRSGVVAAERTLATADGKLPELTQYWNQEIDLVDRCQNCHAAADKCGYSYPEEILNDVAASQMDAVAIRKKYCVSREEADAYAEAAEEMRDSWGDDDEVTFAKVRDKLIKNNPVLATAKSLGMNGTKAEQLFRSHPKRTELLRKHPTQTFGCTTCHYGQGRQTKPVGLNLLKGYWAGADDFTHARSDHYWLSQLLENKKHHTEASCFNCHKNDYELEHAPNLNKARKLVQHVGCTGCHPLGPLDPERKHGPTLVKIDAKMDTGWLVKWIEYPKQLRPRTRMPNFWPEVGRKTPPGERELVCNVFDYKKGAAKSPAEHEDCAKKRDREVGYITAYLVAKSKPAKFPKMPASASAERGRETFESIGCQACHNLGSWEGASTMPGSEDRDIAPNLTTIGDKIKDPGWIYEWVKNPKSWWHQTRMPQLRLTDREAWDVAAYLSQQKSGKSFDISPAVKAAMDAGDAIEKGEKLIAWYGCFGCHEIEGYKDRGRIGVELTDFGSKPPHKLDFGDIPEFVSDHHAQNWEAWTDRKVRDPRSYRYERVETRMPQFDFTEQEVASLILFLKSQNLETDGWPDHIRYKADAKQKAIQRGAYLVDIYNCRGCHLIDDRGIDVDGDRVPDGGDIYKLFADNDKEKFRAPPKLVNEGRKVYPDWFYKFLKKPFKLRENFKIRMPTFQFDDKTAGEIVAYFAAKADAGYPYVQKKVPVLSAADRAMAKQMFVSAQCTNCHVLEGKSEDPKQIAPSLLLTADRLQHDWLFDWLKDPSREIPGVAMPGFFAYDEDTGEYTSPLPNIAGGDWRKQVDLLRAYVISLGAKRGELASASE